MFQVTALCTQGRSTYLKLEDLCDKLANSQSFFPSIRLHSLGGISFCDSSECEEFDVRSFHWRLYCVVAVIALIVNCARSRRPFIYREFCVDMLWFLLWFLTGNRSDSQPEVGAIVSSLGLNLWRVAAHFCEYSRAFTAVHHLKTLHKIMRQCSRIKFSFPR